MQEHPTADQGIISSSLTVSGDLLDLLDLPTEIIEEIAFLSLNPNLYLTSRNARTRLCSQADFIRDLALILLCNRQNPKSTWYGTRLPWRTSAARRWNLAPAQGERELMQRQVFDLEYITAPCLSMMVQHLHATRTQLCSLPAINPTHVGSGSSSVHSMVTSPDNGMPSISLQHQPGLFESAFVRDPFSVGPQGVFVTNMLERLRLPNLFIVHFLYIPTRLLKPDKGSAGEELAHLLLSRASMDSLNHAIVKKYLATAKPLWMYA